MDLHRTLIKDVILPRIKSVFVIDYYEGVRGLLESHHEFPYNDIFANPRIRTKSEIVWGSDAFTVRPRLLAELRGEEKEYYSYLLYQEIEALVALIETLRTEEGGLPLSELLNRCISNIDEKSVYCGDDKVVLVNWGIIPRKAIFEGSGIYRSGKFIGGWDKVHGENPKRSERADVSGDIEAESAASSPVVPEAPESASDETARDVVEIPEVSSGAADSPEPAVPAHDSVKTAGPEETVENGAVDSPEGTSQTADGGSASGKIDESEKETAGEDTVPIKTVPPVIDGKKPGQQPEYGWKQLFHNLWGSVRFLFAKLWWILLMALLIVAGLFGTRNCQGPINRYNPFYSPLPETPVVMPIEEGGVCMSEDGTFRVASDRLNVMLEKEDDSTMLNWARSFKKAYPSSDYEIKYYNEDTYVLQIKVPADQRIRVKNELNSKLPEFGFDVFEEAVYKADFMPNDPALSDPRASWYIDAIGAKEAWNLTRGSDDIIVAVVDNGFDLEHPEFQGKIVNRYNVLTRDGQVRPIVTDEGIDAHGTHVAATAVGNGDNGNGLLGIAPGCRFMPVQVGNDNPDGSMSEMAILEGVLYAINNGADVVNVSLGMDVTDDIRGMSEGEQLNYIAGSFRETEAMWDNVFRKAAEKGCIIVFAAGNENVISGIDPKKRNPQTLRVSAVSPDDRKASFSNFGRYPGLHRDYSTVSAPGVSIYSAAPGNRYMYMQGTSMAAPIVTGAVALMKSADHNLSPDKAISILQRTGRSVDPSIGPVINIGHAVREAAGNDTDMDCERIRAEVQRLQAQIDSLVLLCPGSIEPADTLKYDDVVDDPRSLDGTWKSTTDLVSTSDNSPVELYMTFKNLKGHLTIVSRGLNFTAPLLASVDGRKIHIRQTAPATNPTTEIFFVPYTYACSADRKGNLICDAVSEQNRVSFNLIRIK